MSGRITHSPQRHYCNPGHPEETRRVEIPYMGLDLNGPREPIVADMPITPEAGSIWTCDCGRHWRATFPWINVFAPTWKQTLGSLLGFRRHA